MAVRKKKLLRFIDAPAISSVRSVVLLEGAAACPRGAAAVRRDKLAGAQGVWLMGVFKG